MTLGKFCLLSPLPQRYIIYHWPAENIQLIFLTLPVSALSVSSDSVVEMSFTAIKGEKKSVREMMFHLRAFLSKLEHGLENFKLNLHLQL